MYEETGADHPNSRRVHLSRKKSDSVQIASNASDSDENAIQLAIRPPQNPTALSLHRACRYRTKAKNSLTNLTTFSSRCRPLLQLRTSQTSSPPKRCPFYWERVPKPIISLAREAGSAP